MPLPRLREINRDRVLQRCRSYRSYTRAAVRPIPGFKVERCDLLGKAVAAVAPKRPMARREGGRTTAVKTLRFRIRGSLALQGVTFSRVPDLDCPVPAARS